MDATQRHHYLFPHKERRISDQFFQICSMEWNISKIVRDRGWVNKTLLQSRIWPVLELEYLEKWRESSCQ